MERQNPADQESIADAGMDFETTKNQMAGFIFPTIAEQQSGYFGKMVLPFLQLSHLVWFSRSHSVER